MDAVDGRRELFARIRAALRARGCAPQGAAAPRPSAPSPDFPGAPGLFRLRLEALGVPCLSGPALEPLVPALAETLRIDGVGTLVVPDGDPRAASVAEALVPFGPFTVSPSGEELLRKPGGFQGVVAGIQSADYAVAETGTLVQTSGRGKSLVPGLLAEIHVALVARDALVPALEDCLPALAEEIPQNISLITGPSRTADIEQTMTVGAHGPRKVIVVLLP